MNNIYKKFVTPNFKTIELPVLKGTQKQIAFANAIRDKYTNIFIRKISNFNPLKGTEEVDLLTEKFQKYVTHPTMLESYSWIENHCPKCGCYLKKINGTSYCTNEYCGYSKQDIFHVEKDN